MSKFDELLRRTQALPARQAAPASLLMTTLRELGWHRSVTSRSSVDIDGRPCPWWSYPAIRWLDRALRPDHRVFEFGSGASTHWISERVASVTSVEHNPEWERTVRSTLPTNATLELVGSRASDADAVSNDPYLEPLKAASEPFDLIVVDGLGRNRCAEAAVDQVAAGGLILLDDADRVSYRAAHTLLTAAGFGRLDFYGPRPGVGHMSVTSLFGRDFNAWTRNLTPPEVSGY